MPTVTDGELIFEVYRKYGSECVHLLRGLWSFAVWDAEQKRCFLARDATGTSPLYWWHTRQRLVFATSMKALLAYPGFPHEPDIRAVAGNLAWRVGPDGNDTTAYKNVRQLLPGRQLDFHDDATKVTRWWRPENLSTLHLPNEEDSYEAFTEIYRESARNCVADRAGAIGVSLSAGLDSSSVLAVAAPLVNAAGGRILALTHAPKYELDGTPESRLGDEFPAASMLTRKGLVSTLYIGVSTAEKGQDFNGHAWLRCHHVIVTGGKERDCYLPISWFAPPDSP
jgi:asparagine synthase (glutamine-hydrolysing)